MNGYDLVAGLCRCSAVVFIGLCVAAGCAESPVVEESPPGLDRLMNGSGDFQAFVEESAREGELFRRRLLAGDDPNFPSASLVARAIVSFRERAAPHLEGRPSMASFTLNESDIVRAIEGSGELSVEEVYGAFEGKWYGLWTDFEVDHHWSEAVDLGRHGSDRFEIEGGDAVWVVGLQYAWIGDGYGLNLVALTERKGATDGPHEYLLGYVIHLEDGDFERERAWRPHVGIFCGEGKLIWTTAREVFLEESFVRPSGVEAYAITGFHYEVKDGVLKIRDGTKAFQAVYTRDRDDRPKFYEFDVELEVRS